LFIPCQESFLVPAFLIEVVVAAVLSRRILRICFESRIDLNAATLQVLVGATSPACRSSPVVLDVTCAFQVTRIKVECCRDERFVKARRVNPKNFFAELKRRNVYKVAIAYAVVAWLLMQIATQVFPFLEIPNWAIRLVIMLIVIGFPIALVIAWAFELTPEGLKRTEDVDLSKSITRKTGRKLDFFIIAVLLLVISILLFQRLHPNVSPAVSSSLEKSIAVLPFDSLSRDPDNAYFTEGIQEEILTRLAKIADLKVISRASTQRFKSAPDNLTVIAKQLGVTNILEGSVQKSADQVRVNVQLINALTDAHLWADIYDRKLTDIFAVESDIAKTIADTLQAKLTGSEKRAIAAQPTENSEAHEFYLKGRYFWNKRTANNLKTAISYFQQAIDKDPNYALAYAGLADSYGLLPDFSAGSPQESFPPAKTAAKKALALDDTLAEAHTSLAHVLYLYDLDFDGSTREFRRAIELNPNYATAHHWLGVGPLVQSSRFDDAIAECKRAVELDPLSLINNADLGNTYSSARRYDEAIEQLRKTLEMDPGFYYAHWVLGLAFEAKGALDAAIEEYQKARALNEDPQVLALLGHAYASSGNKTEAVKILEQLKELSKQRYVSAYSLAIVYLGLGDKEEALRWLEKSYQDRAGDVLRYIRVDPLLDPLRGDPRFEELVTKVFAPKNGSSP
jgi:serine/threonine-protein kinase